MPQIEAWSRIPGALRDHLIERMRDRQISIDDLNRLRVWTEAKPEVPEGRCSKTSVRSNYAERADFRKRFFSRANPR